MASRGDICHPDTVGWDLWDKEMENPLQGDRFGSASSGTARWGVWKAKEGAKRTQMLLFKRQNKPRDPNSPPLSRGVWQRFGSVVTLHSRKEIVTSTSPQKTNSLQPGFGCRESRGNCRVDYGVLVHLQCSNPTVHVLRASFCHKNPSGHSRFPLLPLQRGGLVAGKVPQHWQERIHPQQLRGTSGQFGRGKVSGKALEWMQCPGSQQSPG